MKTCTKTCLALFCSVILYSTCGLRASAQNYSIDWYKVAGGGGASSGGQYSVSGTIGQPDAGGVMTGGSYSLTGGFWSLIAGVPAPGLPNLIIQYLNPDSVKVSWPNTGAYTLLQNPNLATGSWTTNANSISLLNGTNSITITPPNGNLFFRLEQ